MKDFFYIGYTSNIEERLLRHNQGREKTTKSRKPFELVFVREFETKREALKYERYLKSLRNKSYLQDLIVSARGSSSIG